MKKQYDAYVTYWSKVHDCITSNYLALCWSFLYNRSYRPFNTFKERLKMNNKLLLHLGIDGPKVNLSFATKLKGEFYKETQSFCS